jgi:hypothetical protein
MRPQRQAPHEYQLALSKADEWLGYPKERRPIVIAIDGRDGVGKSSLASWLGWQLEMPTVALDLFVIRDSDPIAWRVDALNRLIDARIDLRRPIIVEGILLLKALDAFYKVQRRLIWLTMDEREGSCNLRGQFEDYEREYNPANKAALKLHLAPDA